MKNRLFLTVLLGLFFSSFVYSQEYAVDKSASFLAGTASFSSQGGDLFENNGDRLTNLTLASSYNYFVAKNIFIGGALSYSLMSQGDNSYHTLGIGPSVGYAFGETKSKNYPFIAGGISYNTMGDDDDSISGTDIRLGGGMILCIREHLGIVIEAGYHLMSLSHKDWDESQSGNIFTIGVGITGLFY